MSCGAQSILVTEAGSILIGAPAGPTDTDRSIDRGATWERNVNYDTATLFQSSLPVLRGPTGHGALFGDNGQAAYRSLEDGAAGTWETLGVLGGIPVTYGEVPPSAALPEGRLLAGVRNGITTSNDGGQTWTPATGAYGPLQGDSFAFLPLAGHPYGGAVLAGVEDLTVNRDSSATLYRSDDGGASWRRVLRFSPSAMGVGNLTTARLLVTPDGGLWAALTSTRGVDEGAFARSVDGGATWASVSDGYGLYGVQQLIASRDGRLVAATDEGVWRTTGPAWVVAEETEPATPPASVAVSVWPNPTGGAVTVGLSLAEPEVVRVSVVDALGREVAVVHEGAASDGQRLTMDTAGWPVGAYTIRVVTEAGQASAGLMVVR